MGVRALEQNDIGQFGLRSFKYRNMVSGDTTDIAVFSNGVRTLKVYGYGTAAYNIDVYAGPVDQNNKLFKVGQITDVAPTLLLKDLMAFAIRLVCTAGAQNTDVFAVVEEVV